MEDHGDTLHGASERFDVADATRDEFRLRLNVRKVGGKAGAKVIEHAHAPPARRKCFRQVRADETGSAGDET